MPMVLTPGSDAVRPTAGGRRPDGAWPGNGVLREGAPPETLNASWPPELNATPAGPPAPAKRRGLLRQGQWFAPAWRLRPFAVAARQCPARGVGPHVSKNKAHQSGPFSPFFSLPPCPSRPAFEPPSREACARGSAPCQRHDGRRRAPRPASWAAHRNRGTQTRPARASRLRGTQKTGAMNGP